MNNYFKISCIKTRPKKVKKMTDLVNFNNSDSNLGVELVNILYSNTKLNFDSCAFNLIEIFEHLRMRDPSIESLTNNLIKSIEVNSFRFILA